ncbi:CDP-alcohol phosphatidyltransferase family protein [Galbitalea soli]|uniref:CDP-alcohol phosphatidyltransferase family protein n=1 Tax=Galbitalea soli TaxID=1268042 RepID=A0A7C9TNY2_9MICO|nr:CDP-alcohol phosphatidyltransferase family protein [Galbitalea soli]
MVTESYLDTVRRLASAQKKAAPGAPAYSILVNRPAGRLIAALAFRLGLTPNMVTAVSATFTFVGILLLAVLPVSWGLGIAVWLLLAIGYACDSADGQVARLRGGGSRAGEWLDHVVDSLKIVTLHLAVLISAYRNFSLNSPAWLLVPVAFTAVATVLFFAMILNDQLKAVHAAKFGVVVAPTRTGSLRRSLLVLPTDYGLLCLIFVALGAPIVFFVIYTLIFIATAGYLALASVKWFRDMASLDSAGVSTAAPRGTFASEHVAGSEGAQ